MITEHTGKKFIITEKNRQTVAFPQFLFLTQKQAKKFLLTFHKDQELTISQILQKYDIRCLETFLENVK